jgi:hypothetical protein
MKDPVALLLIGAMYENGGNTVHRLMDSHPQLYVYPFESQLGTRLANDSLSSLFPVKYRWPVFPLAGDPESDYELIIDEETKVRMKTPNVSKFRDWPFDCSDSRRKEVFCAIVREKGRSGPTNVEAFFMSTFEAWSDYRRTGQERVYVGYSPVLVVDAERILSEMPHAQFLHVVRNPWSAYADTKKRPVPLSLRDYAFAWSINQMIALQLQATGHPRFHIVRLEDVLADAGRGLGTVFSSLGVDPHSPDGPSWNRQSMATVHPWGTVRVASSEANRATAAELDGAEVAEITRLTSPFASLHGYTSPDAL